MPTPQHGTNDGLATPSVHASSKPVLAVRETLNGPSSDIDNVSSSEQRFVSTGLLLQKPTRFGNSENTILTEDNNGAPDLESKNRPTKFEMTERVASPSCTKLPSVHSSSELVEVIDETLAIPTDADNSSSNDVHNLLNGLLNDSPDVDDDTLATSRRAGHAVTPTLSETGGEGGKPARTPLEITTEALDISTTYHKPKIIALTHKDNDILCALGMSVSVKRKKFMNT